MYRIQEILRSVMAQHHARILDNPHNPELIFYPKISYLRPDTLCSKNVLIIFIPCCFGGVTITGDWGPTDTL